MLRNFEVLRIEDIDEDKLEDTKYRIGLLYNCFKSPNDHSQITSENVLSKVKNELECKKPEKFIDNLMLTPLENIGK